MKSIKVINTIVALALTNVVRAQNKCSSKITELGYPCCSNENCDIVYTDEDGTWGFENNKWCGCEKKTLSECSAKILKQGYPCCSSKCEIIYTDEDGTWSYENDQWCGCKIVESNDTKVDEPTTNVEEEEEESSKGKEIERKWLIDKNKIPYKLSEDVLDDLLIANITQTYICFDPEIRVREYTVEGYGSQKFHEMTIKVNLTKDGLIRDETNITINQQQYNNMLKKKEEEGNVIYKTRYQFTIEDGYYVAIDIFQGDLEGLAYLEIEFPSKKAGSSYPNPDWVIKDITDDTRYKNGHLARYGIPNPQ